MSSNMSWKRDVTAHDTKLEEIARKISELDALRASLYTEQAKIMDSRFAIIAAWAPWRRLPVELLDHIFVLANEADEKYVIPTTISLVCSEWRARALVTRPLWTRVRIHDSLGHDTTHLWLSRSQPALAHVDCSIDEKTISLDTFWSALHLIKSHIGRIVYLKITVTRGQAVDDVVECLALPAPNLSAFEFIRSATIYEYRRGITIQGAERIFKGQTPKLQTLRIMSSHSQWPPGLMANLTELIMTAPTDGAVAYLLDVIESAPRLSRLTIEGYIDVDSGDTTHRTVTLSSLTYAELRGHCSTLDLLLRCLDLPKLHTLHLTHTGLWERGANPNFSPFPSLRILTILSEMLYELEFEENREIRYLLPLLQRCTNVEELRTNTIIALYTLIANLAALSTQRKTGPPLLPRLVVLELMDGDHGVRTLLHKFLESRWKEDKVPSIKVLSLKVAVDDSRDLEEWDPHDAERYASLVSTQVNYNGEVFEHRIEETS